VVNELRDTTAYRGFRNEDIFHKCRYLGLFMGTLDTHVASRKLRRNNFTPWVFVSNYFYWIRSNNKLR
jgi:hypothetical protein